MKLEDFFYLDSDNELFQLALKPPSCGGGPEFKNLAKSGDIFIDTILKGFFNSEGIIKTGVITKEMQKFHNERTLLQIGEHLNVPQYLEPIDENQEISKNDVKEAVEALTEASRQVNGEKIGLRVVMEMYRISVTKGFLDENWIGKLGEYYQKLSGGNPPKIHPLRVGGSDHQPIFQAEYTLTIKGIDYTVTSGISRDKKECRREIAWRMMMKLRGLPDDKPKFNSQILDDTISAPEEVKSSIKTSISDETIIFSRPQKETHSKEQIYISKDTGENILEWAIRKGKKNPFGMLFLLSARLDDVSGASWSSSIGIGELTLLNISLGSDLFFSIGYGSSKSKSKKDAAYKIINQSNLFQWLEEKHPRDVV